MLLFIGRVKVLRCWFARKMRGSRKNRNVKLKHRFEVRGAKRLEGSVNGRERRQIQCILEDKPRGLHV